MENPVDKVSAGKDVALSPVSPAAAAPAPLTPEELKNREKSAGEKIFDRGVYTGIGFGVNEGLSLYLADEFEHGWGKKWFEKAANWLFEKGYFKDGIKNGAKVSGKANAANMLMTLGLLSGGTLLVWPMKWLEDRKAWWVKKINHKMDDGKLSAEDVAKRDAEVDHAIACEPKQTWTSLIPARFLAMSSTTLFGTFIMKDAGNQKVKQWSKDTLTNTANAVGATSLAKTERFGRYAGLTGVETIYCFISSVVLEASSKMLGSWLNGNGKHVKNPVLCPEGEIPDSVPATPPSSAAPIATAPHTPSPVVRLANAQEQFREPKDNVLVKKEKFTDLATVDAGAPSLGMST